MIDRKCCCASTSVGASSAAWPPASMTWSMARMAITVLPEPTSPCSSRCIGNAQARSAEIVSPAARWPSVRRERQPRVERFGQPAGLPRARGGRHRGGGVPALGERGLQHERLVPLEAVPRPAGVIDVQRPVNGPDRLGQPAEAMALAEFSGQRVLTDVEGVEQGPDRPGDLPGGDLGAGRVDRDQFGGVVRCDLGGDTQPARLGQHLAVRVDQLPAAAEGGDRAREQARRLRAQQLLIEPGPVERTSA